MRTMRKKRTDMKHASFWQSVSLEELAEQQGVSPVKDINEISSSWPREENPDTFLKYILQERATRRRVM